jgi:hypothetical protein
MKKCTKTVMRYTSLIGLALVVLSCGTQKNVGYADGIYNDTAEVVPEQQEVAASNVNNDYYKNYFGETVDEVEEITNDSEVFTDVDSYNSNYQNDNAEPEDFTGNGGWGDTSDNVTINFIDNGWGNWGWGPGWGIGWGWGAGWGFGWNNWWGPGWGWGGGWYGPGWGWGGGWYGPGWGYPGWGNGWYAGGYGYSYVNSRRGYNSFANVGRTSSLANRRVALGSRDYRGRSVTRLSQSRLNTDLTRRTRNTIATNTRATRNSSGYNRSSSRSINRSSQSVRSSGVYRNSNSTSRTYNSRSSGSRNSATRSSSSSSRSRGYNTSRSTRSNNSSYRRSSGSSSSSGTMSRGSSSSRGGSMSRGGGSSRSSGGSRSGGRGRG